MEGCRRSEHKRGCHYLAPCDVIIARRKRLLLLGPSTRRGRFIVGGVRRGTIEDRFVHPATSKDEGGYSMSLFKCNGVLRFLLTCARRVPRLDEDRRHELRQVVRHYANNKEQRCSGVDRIVHSLPRRHRR